MNCDVIHYALLGCVYTSGLICDACHHIFPVRPTRPSPQCSTTVDSAGF